ncbi:MAG: type VI secretion system protein TssA [Bryobacteraceae bacterium]|jgi:type VI secretion system protein ImpA
MPLREDILTPIPGANPSGESLEYNPVYDRIKDARREDDDAPQGEWQIARKTADWKAVVQLAGDALATKSKDLQLAAWLTEGLLKRESFAGLRAGLELNKALLETFWDTLYPPIEDGDLDYRATPLEWIGSRLNEAVKQAPLTKSGYSFFKFQESRAVGSEEDTADSPQRADARQAAIDEGKIPVEVFDKAVRETSKDFCQKTVEQLDGCLEAIRALTAIADEKFGNYSPSFLKLRETIEEVRHVANNLYQQKRKEAGELDQPVESEPEPEAVEEEPAAAPVVSSSWGAAAAPARAPVPVRKAVAGLEPTDKEEVPIRLAAIAKYLREQDGYDPAPYLMLRGYRWGELRKGGANPDATLFEPPATEIRTQLKKSILDSDWTAAIEACETAVAQPCGRAWLDLQRYSVTALESYGYPEIANAIKSEVRSLIKDIPDLRRSTLMDDTPTANAETQTWLDQIVAEAGESSAPAVNHASAAMEDEEAPAVAEGEPLPPDAYELALQAIRERRPTDAIEILASEAGRQSSGRGRFKRKQQLAEVCIKLGETSVAQPILEELLDEIDEHKLEGWEAPDTVAYPLTMLLECLGKLDGDAALRQKIYHRICRLDPVQALHCKP